MNANSTEATKTNVSSHPNRQNERKRASPSVETSRPKRACSEQKMGPTSSFDTQKTEDIPFTLDEDIVRNDNPGCSYELREKVDVQSSLRDLADECISENQARDENSSENEESGDEIEDSRIKNMMSCLDDNEIDEILQANASKSNLTVTNVRTILKHIITNDYVMAMVRNTMRIVGEEQGDLEECPFEPTLTRSKAKQLRAQKAVLPWPVSLPVIAKSQSTTKKLLLEDLAEDDGSSDEEYTPTEEECHSELDVTPELKEKDVEPAVDSEPEYDNLVIAEPEAPGSDIFSDIGEEDLIALRTRSKLPLTDTPLETIEASFVAPDITIDMYDTECDDEEWQEFLRDFVRPLDEKASSEHPDDNEDDPEYNVFDDEDVDDIIEDLDQSGDCEDTDVTQDEIQGLIGEMFDVTQEELNDFVFTEQQIREMNFIDEQKELPIQEEQMLSPDKESLNRRRTQWMIAEEKIQVEQQMRMHVQLLAQTYLMSYDIPNLSDVAETSKSFLKEVQLFGIQNTKFGSRSTFYAHNLDHALSMVRDLSSETEVTKKKATNSNEITNNKKEIMAHSKAFIYPHLLPLVSFRKNQDFSKMTFTDAETNLIAIALEEFSWLKTGTIEYICGLLLPTKTPIQVYNRIRNCRKKRYFPNPIQYFFKHNVAPPFPRHLRYFNPNEIKPLCELSAEVLPRWMHPYLKTPPKIVPSSPIPEVVPLVKIVTTTDNTQNGAKFRTILPRLSPLKKITPILRKYYQHRRVFAVAPVPTQDPEKKKKKKDKIQDTLLNFVPIAPAPCNSEKQVLETSSSGDHSNKKTNCNSSTEAGEDSRIEAVDDEQDLAALMAASSTMSKKPHSPIKKKNKQQRDLESTMALLSPELQDSDPKKEARETLFAQSYLVRVIEALKTTPEKCEEFLKLLCSFDHGTKSPVQMFEEIKELLFDFPDLIEDFVGFLMPQQAKECGKYKEYIILSKIRSFLRKLEVHFSHQPHHIQRILKTLSQLQNQKDIMSPVVIAALQPLLRNQSHLLEEFMQLLPNATPPECLMTDFEEIEIPNSENDNSSSGSVEEITIPDTPDPYGSKDCPCLCHTSTTDLKIQNRSRHCTKCGTKFLDGKIYIQTGKVLKPAQVIFHSKPGNNISMNAQHSSDFGQSASNEKICYNSEDNRNLECTNLKLKTGHHKSKKTESEVCSTFPCDVMEDAVLPPDANLNLVNAPSDFSHLKDVISSQIVDEESLRSSDSSASGFTSITHSTAVSANTRNLEQSTSTKVPCTTITKDNSPDINNLINSIQALPTLGDQDKIILRTCLTYGENTEAFQIAANALKCNHVEQVRNRFYEIVECLRNSLEQ